MYSDYDHNRIADFSDADWTCCPIDRMSNIGYCVFIGENMCRERVIIKMLSLDLLRSQNIGVWLILHVSLC